MQTSRLDAQLDALGVDYQLLGEGLPRAPFAKPSFPVLAKVAGTISFFLMAKDSILTLRNAPHGIGKLETFNAEDQRKLSKNLGLEKMTLLCGKAQVYFDAKLLNEPRLTLPVGDKTRYLSVLTEDLISVLGDKLKVIELPALEITPDDLLDGSDFSRARVRQAMNNISSIPPFPVTARGIIELSQKPEFDIDELVRIVDRDSPIVSSLLSWANAVAIKGTRGEVSSLTGAIQRLGTRATMDYALQASMMKSFRTEKALAPLVQFACFNSLHSAHGAKAVSSLHQTDDEATHAAYLAGLMYNLGELLMIQCFPERAREYLITQGINPHLSRELLSREMFKVSFASSTDLLMDAWAMPSAISAAGRDLASYNDEGQNKVAADIRLWQVNMLDAGRMPYAHAPFGWEHLPVFPLGQEIARRSEAKIQEFLSFSASVAQGIR